MKKIERFNLIDKIGRELQSKMSYNDINIYLSGFGIDYKKETSGINSKWIYVKELLADTAEKVILEIANELGIKSNSSHHETNIDDINFWKPGNLKLFLSHLSSFKTTTSKLQEFLNKYAISGFVAHEDIKPTKDWQIEIEKALFTMDALVAVLTNGFQESKWTDQEVGVAIGRNILVIPVIKDINPYGLFGKYQGLKTNGKSIEDVAYGIYEILIQNEKTRSKMLSAVSNQFLLSTNSESANFTLGLLFKEDELPIEIIENIRENAFKNRCIKDSDDVVDKLNKFLVRNGYNDLSDLTLATEIKPEDLPF